MLVVFEKSLSEGSVRAHVAQTWDELKYNLATNVDTFPVVEWEAAGFGWNRLRQGDIIADGANAWRYFDIDHMSPCTEIFEGRLIALSEIDPVF